MTPNTLLKREEAAELLSVSPNTLAMWASNKRYNLPYSKIGRLVRYKLSDIERFIAQRTVVMSGGANA